jgi:hypothetical protein
MIEDMCKFVKQIESDPEAIVSGLTVRDYLQLRLHIHTCEQCYESVDRVRERYPNDNDGGQSPIITNMN